MDKKAIRDILVKFRKLIVAGLFALIGILLMFSGLGLITISPVLTIYAGIFFLIVALAFYFLV